MKSTVFKRANPASKKKKDVKAQPECGLKMSAVRQASVESGTLRGGSAGLRRSLFATRGPHPRLSQRRVSPRSLSVI